MKKSILFVTLIFGLTQVQSQSNFQLPTIVIMPFFDENGSEKIELNTLIAQEFSTSFDVCCQQRILHLITEHNSFNQSYQKIFNQDLSKANRSNNLYKSLTDEEKNEFINEIGNISFLVFPKAISSKGLEKINGTKILKSEGGVVVFNTLTGNLIANLSDKITLTSRDLNPAERPQIKSLFASLNEQLIKHLN